MLHPTPTHVYTHTPVHPHTCTPTGIPHPSTRYRLPICLLWMCIPGSIPVWKGYQLCHAKPDKLVRHVHWVPQSLPSFSGARKVERLSGNEAIVNPIESSGSHHTFYTHSTAKYGFRPPGNVTCTPYTMCMLNTKSANTLMQSTWLLGLSPPPPPPPPPTHTHTRTR